MVQILVGRVGARASLQVIDRMAEQVSRSDRKQVLLVPENISHCTEMELARREIPALSRQAEVLSFQRLVYRVLELTGGLSEYALDAGGKLLTMQRALQEVSGGLRVYQRYAAKEGFLSGLVELAEEFQAYCVQPEELAKLAEENDGSVTGQKLWDLSLIYSAYRRLLCRDGSDRRDVLDKLEERLEDSGYLDGKDVWLDGFTYFSARELRILRIMMRRARQVTITLLGDCDSDEPVLNLWRSVEGKVRRLAQECGKPCVVTPLYGDEPMTAVGHLEAHFFGRLVPWQGDCSGIVLHRADSMYTEVEYTAARILALVREQNCRFRDIAVIARNLQDYEATIEHVFERYGVPIYLSRSSDILEKPLLSLIAGVLDAVSGGYEYEDMFRWLKTGFSGLSDRECDLLENYVIRWDIRGSMWLREEDWSANPEGWQEGFTQAQSDALAEINAYRRKVQRPLSRLVKGLKEGDSAREKLERLYEFLEEIELPEKLREYTEKLEEAGRLQQAQEYSQLWEVLCGVMTQFAEILGEYSMGIEEFARLIKLALTQYDVGTIPAAVDQVQVSQMERKDCYPIRHLFLIGANDHVLPAVARNAGLLNLEDRAYLDQRGITLAPGGDTAFDYEMLHLYAALCQSREGLTVSWPAAALSGELLRPSFVTGRIKALLPAALETAEDGRKDYRLSACLPALELSADRGGENLRAYFRADPLWAEKLEAMERASRVQRGRLSPEAVRALYGKSYRMSASRIDKVNSCHFAYFMQYGLKAKERAPAGFDAAQVGTFLHYVLEHVTRQAMERGGFGELDEKSLKDLIDRVIRDYMASAMPNFDERDARFKYLFRRLKKTVTTIMENVAEELSESDFVPLAFELDFGDQGSLPAISIRTAGAELSVVGQVDRVDGWLKDGKLYLRVVDYKSGRKAFDLSDIRYGLNLQMLLYLFTLEKEGKALFGHDIVPAGVMYLPARDVMLNLDRGTTPEELRAALDKELRRSGMVLGEAEVLRAMEHSALEEPRFLPLTLGRDGSITKGIATAEQLGKLGRYVEKLLVKVADELRDGNIDADPCGHNENDSVCTYCEFASACHFMDGCAEDRMQLLRPVAPQVFWEYVDETIGKEDV